ncbi:MAG: protein tyrosine phosphatase family protein [Flavobacteriales bacterium]
MLNFLQISPSLSCCGQPSAEDFKSISKDFEVVINLGLADQDYSLADEKSVVENLQMEYHHIPVLFDNPTIADIEQFFALMKNNNEKKILVHCAANYRASVFVALYLFAINKLEEDEIGNFIRDVWMPDQNWELFTEEAINLIRK